CDQRVRCALSAHDPPERSDSRIERGLTIRHLCQRDIHRRKWIAIRRIACVADDTDDLTRRLSERTTDARRLLQPVPKRVSLWPVLLRHGLIDQNDSGSGRIVVISKRTAAEKR